MNDHNKKLCAYKALRSIFFIALITIISVPRRYCRMESYESCTWPYNRWRTKIRIHMCSCAGMDMENTG